MSGLTPSKSHSHVEWAPDTRLPRTRLVVRLLIAAACAVYLFWLPLDTLLIPNTVVAAATVLYIPVHLLIWRRFLRRGFTKTWVVLSCAIDITGAHILLLIDPYPIPPVLPLSLLSFLGNGLEHGRRTLVTLSIIGVSLTVWIFAIRTSYLHRLPGYDLVFIGIFLSIVLLYGIKLLLELQKLKSGAERSLARDPLTHLLQKAAFEESANYLVSLHNRTHTPMVCMSAEIHPLDNREQEASELFDDHVIKRFAEVAQTQSSPDDLLARHGTARFLMLLTDTTLDGAILTAKTLQQHFDTWAIHTKHDCRVLIKLYAFPQKPKTTINEAIERLDNATWQTSAIENNDGLLLVKCPGTSNNEGVE